VPTTHTSSGYQAHLELESRVLVYTCAMQSILGTLMKLYVQLPVLCEMRRGVVCATALYRRTGTSLYTALIAYNETYHHLLRPHVEPVKHHVLVNGHMVVCVLYAFREWLTRHISTAEYFALVEAVESVCNEFDLPYVGRHSLLGPRK
jgi:hypothetical protein